MKEPRKDSRIHQDDQPGGLTHNPFAALRARGGSPAPESTPAAEPTKDERADTQAEPSAEAIIAPRKEAKTAPAAAARRTGPRLVVQREKKGRAGKVVTRIAGLTRAHGDPAALARELKRALGCGATLDGPDILLQGALTERAAAWLRERLDADVTIGN